MAARLPDETLREILDFHLHVADNLFADTSLESPFTHWQQSSADALLVCQRWTRIGTPSLYETVVLRTSAQARGLALALSSNPSFARFVRKLRLEGVFSKYIGAIATLAPDITDLCLSPHRRAGESVAGLCKALHTFRPRRLVLGSPLWTHCLDTTKIDAALCSGIRSSTKLEEVVCPDHRTPLVVIEALSDCSSLRVVYNLLSSAGFIPGSDGSAFTNTLYPDAALTLLAKNKSITRVSARFQIVGLQREHHLANVTTIDAVSPLFPPHTSLDLVYTWADGIKLPWKTRPILTLEDHFTAPSFDFSHLPQDIRRRIWSHCVDWALRSTGSGLPAFTMWGWFGCCTRGWVDKTRYDVATASSLILVSEAFYHLSLERLVKHIVLCCEIHLAALRNILARTPELAALVRTIAVSPGNDEEHFFDGNALRDLLSSMPNLVEVTSLPSDSESPSLYLPATLLSAMSAAAGSRLTALHLRLESESSHCLGIFAGFSALRRLYWEAPAVDIELAEPSTLPELEELHVIDCHWSFLGAFAQMELPRLRIASFPPTDLDGCDEFLSQHGPQLVHATFEGMRVNTWIREGCPGWTPTRMRLCTALETLTLTGLTEAEARSFVREPHQTLRHLDVLMYLRHFNGQPMSYWSPWRSLLLGISPENFPALRTITVRNCKWPTKEEEIKSSIWPGMAIIMADKGVKLRDEEGREWRARSDGTRRNPRRRAATNVLHAKATALS